MKNIPGNILVIIIFFSYSCEKKEIDLSEDRGTLLTTELQTYYLDLTWSKSNDEIIAAGNTGIHAININTQAVRTIDGTDGVHQFNLSNDGNKLYYILTGFTVSGAIKPFYSISLDGHDRQLLLNNVFVSHFSLSPENLVAYHWTSDSLYLYNDVSTSNTFLTVGNPITFSPDGKQLLCSDAFAPNFFTISIENGTIQYLSLPEDVFSTIMFRWDESGIWVFFRGNDDISFYIHNFTTKATSKLWQSTPDESPLDFAWSADGKKIGYLTQRCLQGLGFFSCDVSQSNLHIFDINKKQESRVAYGNEEYAGSIAFSPNGAKIAYVLGSQIYTQDIP